MPPSSSARSPGAVVAEALIRESRAGLVLAAQARLAALAAVALWLALAYPEPWALYYHGVLLLLALLGLGQIAVVRRAGSIRPTMILVALDALLLVAALLAPNPLLGGAVPPALALRYDNGVFVYVVLASLTLGGDPRLVLLYGVAAAGAWLGGALLLAALPGSATELDSLYRAAAAPAERVRLFLDPGHVHLASQVKQAVVILIVAALLAASARRTRRLVFRNVAAERARANLARHLPADRVEELAGRDAPFGPVRRQEVAVLFVDLRGFTAFCESAPPEAVISGLRRVLGALAEAVFAHGGTLDKYLGDGLMATFGTPRPRPDDAARALACARAMLDAVGRLDFPGPDAGAPNRLAVGLHAGPVVLGEVGHAERLEFTALGDTVNVASRLEALCRPLNASLVVGDALVRRLDPTADAALLRGLRDAGPVALPGRAAGLRVWTLDGPEPPPASPSTP